MKHRIIREARSWLDTPFHHQARLKGGGCDCLGLIVGVAAALQLKDKNGVLLAEYDEIDYSFSPDSGYLIAKLGTLLQETPFSKVRSGDIGLFLIDDNPQHLAIFVKSRNEISIIHAEGRCGKVVEHRVDEEWQQKLFKVFRWQV